MTERERGSEPLPGGDAALSRAAEPAARGARSDGRGEGPGPRNGHVPFPRTERPDAPAYLRTYLERRAREDASSPAPDDRPSAFADAPAFTAADRAAPADRGNGHLPGTAPRDALEIATPAGTDSGTTAVATTGEPAPRPQDLPLYLRRFRERRVGHGPDLELPLVAPGIDGERPTWTDAWAQTSRSNELVPPPEMRPPEHSIDETVDVHLVRHGETQGYSANAGLTPMGRWQAQRRGHDLSKGVRDGQPVRIVCAPTARATQTAEQLRRGVDDGLVLWGRTAEVEGPEPMDEFRNFSVWTPSGEKDVTSAFREYHAVSERYERVAMGDRPLWLVEIDRFYRLQMGGGDAIHFWMTVPLVCFEPPAAVVLRFWAGIATAIRNTPEGGRVFVATHSGPIRAFATWALGHDAGEPYNVEEVRLRVRRSLREAQVTYRNRTAEVQIPAADQWPSWWAERAAAVAADHSPRPPVPVFPRAGEPAGADPRDRLSVAAPEPGA